MWSKRFVENWSAFAPNFTVLEKNSEHREEETEFDANLPDQAPAATIMEGGQGDPTAPVDILGAWLPRAPGDAEVEGCLEYVSIFPDREVPDKIYQGSEPRANQHTEVAEAELMAVP